MNKLKITVGEFLERFNEVPRDAVIQFSGGLDFFDVELRNPKLFHIMFNENVYQDQNGKVMVDTDREDERFVPKR